MNNKEKICLITAIMPLTTTMPIIRALHEMGVYTANKSAARGSSNTSARHDVEMEVMTVLIKQSRADEIFAFIYEKGGLYEPNHGIIFESDAILSSCYTLPN